MQHPVDMPALTIHKSTRHTIRHARAADRIAFAMNVPFLHPKFVIVRHMKNRLFAISRIQECQFVQGYRLCKLPHKYASFSQYGNR